jgi:hypothetical protein
VKLTLKRLIVLLFIASFFFIFQSQVSVYGSYTGTQSPPSSCGEVGQPPCPVINDDLLDKE